jgi:hypothetical protein
MRIFDDCGLFLCLDLLNQKLPQSHSDLIAQTAKHSHLFFLQIPVRQPGLGSWSEASAMEK